MSDHVAWVFKTPEQKKAAVAEMWEKGLTSTVIADRLGTTKSAVLGIAHRSGLDKRCNANRIAAWATPDRVAAGIKMISECQTWRIIHYELEKLSPVPLPRIATLAAWFNERGYFMPPQEKKFKQLDNLKRGRKRHNDGNRSAPDLRDNAVARPKTQRAHHKIDRSKDPGGWFDNCVPRPTSRLREKPGAPKCLWTEGDRGSYWMCDSDCKPKDYTDGFHPFCEHHFQFGFRPPRERDYVPERERA